MCQSRIADPDGLPLAHGPWPNAVYEAYSHPRSRLPTTDSHSPSSPLPRPNTSHIMNADHPTPDSPVSTASSYPSSPAGYSPTTAPCCYFSIVPATHFSLETPTHSPVSEYQPHTPSDPTHPLLAFRLPPPLSMSSPNPASGLLQLQTQAAYRPTADPLQQQQQQHRASSASSTGSNSSSSSSSSSSSHRTSMGSPSTLCCCRCRRECVTSMYQIGTNRYYCSHCARMTGYSAG